MGRSNFDCNLEPAVTADIAECTVGGCPYKDTDRCDYYRQRNAAARSDRAALNYQYWLHQANYS